MSKRARTWRRGGWFQWLTVAVVLAFVAGILIRAGFAQPPPPPPPAPSPDPAAESPESPGDILPWLVEQHRRTREMESQEQGQAPSRRDPRYPPPIVQRVPDVAGVYNAAGDSRLKIQQQGNSIRALMGLPEGLSTFSGTFQNKEFQGKGGTESYRQCFFGEWELLDLAQGAFVKGVGALYPHPTLPETIVLDRWRQGNGGYIPLSSLQFTRDTLGQEPGLVKTPPGPGPLGPGPDLVKTPPGPDLVETPPRPPGGSGEGSAAPPGGDRSNLPGVDQLGDGAGFR